MLRTRSTKDIDFLLVMMMLSSPAAGCVRDKM